MKEHSWVDMTALDDEQREWKCEDCGRRVRSTTEMVAADREGCGPEQDESVEGGD